MEGGKVEISRIYVMMEVVVVTSWRREYVEEEGRRVEGSDDFGAKNVGVEIHVEST